MEKTCLFVRYLALFVLVPVLTCCGPQSTVKVTLSPEEQLKYDSIPGTVELGDIDYEHIAPVVEALKARPPTLTILITSPGGFVSVGWQLIAEMEAAQAEGTTIACIVDRYAASMAAVIYTGACDVRLIRKGAYLMFHTASVGHLSGNQWDIERAAREIESVNKRIAIYVSARLSISQAEYEAKVFDHDWFLGAEEAMEIGAADEALPPLRR